MLVLSRRENESFYIGSDITIKLLRARDNVARIAIDAPKNVLILRSELAQNIAHTNAQSSQTAAISSQLIAGASLIAHNAIANANSVLGSLYRAQHPHSVHIAITDSHINIDFPPANPAIVNVTDTAAAHSSVIRGEQSDHSSVIAREQSDRGNLPASTASAPHSRVGTGDASTATTAPILPQEPASGSANTPPNHR